MSRSTIITRSKISGSFSARRSPRPGGEAGIRRFGHASIPLDEALAEVTVDLSGRPYLVYQVQMPKKKIKEFDTDLVEHFFRAVVDQCKINLHINLHYGKDPHHILEAIFKGFGRALDEATQIDPRLKGSLRQRESSNILTYENRHRRLWFGKSSKRSEGI